MRCHICEEDRPDEQINVIKENRRIVGAVRLIIEIWYCNDRPECKTAATVIRRLFTTNT
jgi:hypothetical protein